MSYEKRRNKCHPPAATKKKNTVSLLPLLQPSPHPRRRSPEGGLDIVEELAERPLCGERSGHGVVTVVHRRVVLVQEEQQPDLIGEGGCAGGKVDTCT